MTSPVGGLINAVHQASGPDREYGGFISDEMRVRLMRAVFHEYYAGLGHDVVIDTNRLWCARMELLADLFPECRVVCTVRSVAWVLDSLERLHARNVLHPTKVFRETAGQTIYQRVDGLARLDRLVGFSYHALRGACWGPQRQRVLLVPYERLTAHPAMTVQQIYEFLGLRPYHHDFENVEYGEDEFDERLGVEGLHQVRRVVKYEPRETILPPDLFEKYAKTEFWRSNGCPVKVVV